jgi:hypothetical protein
MMAFCPRWVARLAHVFHKGEVYPHPCDVSRAASTWPLQAGPSPPVGGNLKPPTVVGIVISI